MYRSPSWQMSSYTASAQEESSAGAWVMKTQERWLRILTSGAKGFWSVYNMQALCLSMQRKRRLMLILTGKLVGVIKCCLSSTMRTLLVNILPIGLVVWDNEPDQLDPRYIHCFACPQQALRCIPVSVEGTAALTQSRMVTRKWLTWRTWPALRSKLVPGQTPAKHLLLTLARLSPSRCCRHLCAQRSPSKATSL